MEPHRRRRLADEFAAGLRAFATTRALALGPAARVMGDSSPESAPSPRPLRVAFQGAPGAFSEDAVRALYGAQAEPLPCRTFRDVTAAVLAGRAESGVLPIANTIAGPIADAEGAIAAADGLRAAGEVVLAVHLCLLAPVGAVLGGVRTVASHPVALRQCVASLRTLLPAAELREVFDTAGAAAAVASRGDRSAAAVASRRAGDRYGLAILAEGIEDVPGNSTRFVVVTRGAGRPAAPDEPAA